MIIRLDAKTGFGLVVAGLTMALVLPGCSTVASVGHAVNPMRIFDRAPDEPVTEGAAGVRRRAGEGVAGSGEQPNPRISDVPARPEIASRSEVQQGIVADRGNAAYVGQTLRDSGTNVPAAPVSTQSQDAVRRASIEAGGGPDPVAVASLREALATSERVSVAIIQFPYNSYSIAAADVAILDQIVELADLTGAGIQIVGHASGGIEQPSSVSLEEANLRVSMERANAVAEVLIGLGVDRDQLTVQAVGDSEPAYAEDTPEGEAGNRRAEVYLRQ